MSHRALSNNKTRLVETDGLPCYTTFRRVPALHPGRRLGFGQTARLICYVGGGKIVSHLVGGARPQGKKYGGEKVVRSPPFYCAVTVLMWRRPRRPDVQLPSASGSPRRYQRSLRGIVAAMATVLNTLSLDIGFGLASGDWTAVCLERVDVRHRLFLTKRYEADTWRTDFIVACHAGGPDRGFGAMCLM